MADLKALSAPDLSTCILEEPKTDVLSLGWREFDPPEPEEFWAEVPALLLMLPRELAL